MPVPEAAVHEYHGAEAWQHEIGPAREETIVQAVAEAKRVQLATEGEFWRGVTRSYARHSLRTLPWRQEVDHS